jgi:CelD/BcsL family acetyltransferase involved in cellulose biosynthesis
MVSKHSILGRKRRVVEFIGAQAADYCDFIVEPGRPTVVLALLDWLAKHADRWDLLQLTNIAETSALLKLLPRTFRQQGYEAEVHTLYECPTRVFGDRAADEQLLNDTEVRRRYKKLSRQGAVQFERYQDPAEMERALEPFFQQHIDRWAGTPTPSFFHDERQRVFYRELVRRLASRGWVLFSAVSFKATPISFHFGYEYGGRIYFIKPTFHPEYRPYGPGMLHIKYLLEYAMQRSASEFDFTWGSEGFKYQFANRARLNYAARVHHRALFYGIDRLLAYAKALTRRAPAVRRMGGRLIKPWLGETLQRLGL